MSATTSDEMSSSPSVRMIRARGRNLRSWPAPCVTVTPSSLLEVLRCELGTRVRSDQMQKASMLISCHPPDPTRHALQKQLGRESREALVDARPILAQDSGLSKYRSVPSPRCCSGIN